MAFQKKSALQNDNSQFAKLFAAVISLRLIQRAELYSLLSRRRCREFLNVAGDYLRWPKSLIDYLRAAVDENELASDVAKLNDAQFSRAVCLGEDNREEYCVDEALARLSKSHRRAVRQMLKKSLQIAERELQESHCDLTRNVEFIRNLVGLDEVECRILLYTAMVSQNALLNDFLRGISLNSRDKGADMLATAINTSAPDVSMAMRKNNQLLEYAFIKLDASPRDMEDLIKLPGIIESCINQRHGSIQELMSHFVDIPSAGTLSSTDYPHLAEDLGYLARFLKGAINARAEGVNVLLHGIPGTGKTELAKLLGQELGSSLYEVTSKDEDGDAANRSERLVSLKLSQRFLSGDGNSLVLLDEAEDIFEHSEASMFGKLLGRKASHGKGADSKAWINRLLETNSVPVIWVSNDIEQIDPAALRRFSYILEVRMPPLQVRRSIAAKHLGHLPVSEKFLDRLAEQTNLVPALLANAAKVVQLSGVKGQMETESFANRVIRLTQEAMGEKTTSTLRTSVTGYSLDYLNIESRHSIEKILSALKIRSSGTLCFYGLPGTGKTALAEHIARTLDRPLIARRTSELMSKWVGETEKQIAAMFREAENEKAIVFLDEADSFLADRQQANRSWEVTQVNELLQQMERFTGVFICATNLFETLDAAALRRFTFKLKFNAMTLAQRQQMFMQEALQGNGSLLTPSLRSRLQSLDMLTPGDFSTVKRQVELFGELHSPDEFMSQLEMEVVIKQKGGHRAMGFVA